MLPTPSLIRQELGDIHDHVMSLDNETQFGNALVYEFYPFLGRNLALHEEFMRRAEFYPRLAVSSEFTDLIDGIHKSLEDLYPLIEREKIVSKEKHFNHWARSGHKDPEWLSSQQMLDLFVHREKWEVFGGMFGDHFYQIEAFTRTSSFPFLVQYEVIRIFIDLELQPPKMTVTPEASDLIQKIEEDMDRLDMILNQSMFALHVRAFDSVYDAIQRPQFIIGKPAVKSIKDDFELVYKDLTLFMAQQEATQSTSPKSNSRRMTVRYLGDFRLKYDDDEFLLPKNYDYAKLSDKLYAHCQQVGSIVDCETIWNEWRPTSYNLDPFGNWKKLYQAVRALNRWAKRQKNLPDLLFECTTPGVERLV